MTNKQRLLRILAGIAAFGVFVFIVSRFSHIVLGPRIILDEVPASPLTEKSFTLSGILRGGKLFYINGVQIPVNTDGTFLTRLVVPDGYSILTLEAEDELGVRRRKGLHVYALPREPLPTPASKEPPEESEEPAVSEDVVLVSNENELE